MEARKYPTYHYLKFIWDKKFWVIGITILFMILAAAYSYMQGKKPTYTASAIIFTGNANNDALSKPEIIIGKYKDTVSLPFNVDILDKMVIKITASDKNKAKVEDAIKKVADEYYNDLSVHYTKQEKMRIEIDTLLKDNAIFPKEDALQQDETKQVEPEEVDIQKALGLHDYIDNKIELTLMEKPKKPEFNNAVSSNNLMRNVVLAGALGFQFMLILLVFWKYIIDARRFNS